MLIKLITLTLVTSVCVKIMIMMFDKTIFPRLELLINIMYQYIKVQKNKF